MPPVQGMRGAMGGPLVAPALRAIVRLALALLLLLKSIMGLP